MKQIYINSIATRLQVKDWQVENCITLFEDGATIPFISRYRKERTGGLDEVAIAEIRHWADVFTEMEKRKETVLENIEQAGSLTPQLRKRIEDCVESRELEDIYLPYKPKRRTRATIAKEAGLEPLAETMFDVGVADPAVEALIQARQDAKKAKNFAEADRIRDELKAQGIEVTDVAGGAKWKRI